MDTPTTNSLGHLLESDSDPEDSQDMDKSLDTKNEIYESLVDSTSTWESMQTRKWDKFAHIDIKRLEDIVTLFVPKFLHSGLFNDHVVTPGLGPQSIEVLMKN